LKLSAILEPLVAAGVDSETLLKTVRAYENQQEDALEKRRSADRDRQARKREKDGSSRDVTLRHSDSQPSRSRARGEDNLQTKNSTGQEENKKEAAPKALSDLAAFRADLEQDASPEQVEAFVKHRKTKKGQNSAYSAKLFRKDAAACGLSVSQAIDTAISRGWLTVKPEYLVSRNQPQQRATAPPGKTGKPTLASMWTEEAIAFGIIDEPASTQDRRLDAGLARGPDQGTGYARRIASA